MSFGERLTRYLLLAGCASTFLWSVGCTSFACPAEDQGPSLIRVARLSGGDAPTVDVLKVTQDGEVRLEKVGFRSYCGEVPKDDFESLRALVEATVFEEIMWSTGTGLHYAEAHVHVGRAEVRVILRDPPRTLVPLFAALDKVFWHVFGRRYDMPLLVD